MREARQVVQALIAPELRSLGVKLDSLKKRFEASELKGEVSAMRTQLDLTNRLEALAMRVNPMSESGEQY